MSQPRLPLDAGPALGSGTAVDLAPGAVCVPGWLSLPDQRELLDACRAWARPPAGLRRPRMPNGAPFTTRAVCLGWHWYPYRYSRTCDDHDGAPVKPFPDLLRRLGTAACRTTGYEPAAYDAAIVNFYDRDAKLGLHQDDGEGESVIANGSPVVTISLGDTCVFRLGNTETRTRPYRDIELASGDLLVFGGPARLAYHGVPKIRAGTAPPGVDLDGRISVTLRESGHS